MTFTTDRPGVASPPFPSYASSGVSPLDTRPGQPSRLRRLARRVTSEGGMVMLLTLAVYLVLGVLLDFHYQTFALDAVSRLANGFYLLYSRDPHLAAVGFVWNPG